MIFKQIKYSLHSEGSMVCDALIGEKTCLHAWDTQDVQWLAPLSTRVAALGVSATELVKNYIQ